MFYRKKPAVQKLLDLIGRAIVIQLLPDNQIVGTNDCDHMDNAEHWVRQFIDPNEPRALLHTQTWLPIRAHPWVLGFAAASRYFGGGSMNLAPSPQRNLSMIKGLTFFTFMMFAVTTESVGVIIPEVIKEFHLSMTVAGPFHYAAMSGIAFAGFFLGYLADKVGRKKYFLEVVVISPNNLCTAHHLRHHW